MRVAHTLLLDGRQAERRSSSASALVADNRRGSRNGAGERTLCRVRTTTGFSLWRRVRVHHRSQSEMTFPRSLARIIARKAPGGKSSSSTQVRR